MRAARSGPEALPGASKGEDSFNHYQMVLEAPPRNSSISSIASIPNHYGRPTSLSICDSRARSSRGESDHFFQNFTHWLFARRWPLDLEVQCRRNISRPHNHRDRRIAFEPGSGRKSVRSNAGLVRAIRKVVECKRAVLCGCRELAAGVEPDHYAL